MNAKNLHPWEQQEGESVQAYEAFRTYLALHSRRSLVAAARKIGKSTTLLERWSARWAWPDRVDAWHRVLQREYDSDLMAAILENRMADWHRMRDSI
jgi:hypothetical protein